MDRLHQFALALVVAGTASPAHGDAPLGPPTLTTVCSSNHAFCATADPAANMTTIHEAQNNSALWQIAGWHRYLYLSNDGEYVVVLYGGANLVPVDVSAHEAMLRFYVRGNLVRTVELGEWFPDPSRIEQTTSHRHWGNVEALTDSNQLVVQLSDGRRISYNVSSGTKDAP